MNRTCPKCKATKPLTIEYFATRKDRDGWQNICRPCQSVYRKKHYQENKQKYIDKAHDWKIAQKVEFYTWLSSKSCVDCGVTDIRVLSFDHLNDKDYGISEKIGLVRLSKLMPEIEKCEIVCLNCHAIRTATRGNFYKFLTCDNDVIGNI